jgi:hypothetical protein
MRKADALRLRPGDKVLWGHSSRVEDVVRAGSAAHGRVVRVTPRGGVQVQEVDRKEWHGPQTDGPVYWVPYHHIISRA